MFEIAIKAIIIFIILLFIYNWYRFWKWNKILDKNIPLWIIVNEELGKDKPNFELAQNNLNQIQTNIDEFAEYFNIENINKWKK